MKKVKNVNSCSLNDILRCHQRRQKCHHDISQFSVSSRPDRLYQPMLAGASSHKTQYAIQCMYEIPTALAFTLGPRGVIPTLQLRHGIFRAIGYAAIVLIKCYAIVPMLMSWHGNPICTNGRLWGKSIYHWWIWKIVVHDLGWDGNVDLWCLLCWHSEQVVE